MLTLEDLILLDLGKCLIYYIAVLIFNVSLTLFTIDYKRNKVSGADGREIPVYIGKQVCFLGYKDRL